jgi:hypothetical protein
MGCLSAGVLPQDASGLYFLISSPEVSQKGFCVDYCGWHDVGPNNMLCAPRTCCCHRHALTIACLCLPKQRSGRVPAHVSRAVSFGRQSSSPVPSADGCGRCHVRGQPACMQGSAHPPDGAAHAQVRLCGQHAALPQHVPGADGGAQRRERAGRRRVHPRARDRRDDHRPQHRRLVRRPARVGQRSAPTPTFKRASLRLCQGRFQRPARCGHPSREGSRTADCRAVGCIQDEGLRQGRR